MQRGRNRSKISDAEWCIMQVLWDGCAKQDRGLTLGEVVDALSHSQSWTNTTIRTMLIRLSEKDAVTIDKSAGVYQYRPRLERESCIRDEVDSFVARVFAGSLPAFVTTLVQEHLDEGERRELLRALMEKEA